MANLLTSLIRLYQKTGKLFLPQSCRYYPSCSCYAIDAIQKYGTLKGTYITIKRIARCSPFFKGGYDPVQ